MGTANSTLVSNFEATPQVLNNSALLHGVMRVAQGTVVVAAGDSDVQTTSFKVRSQRPIRYTRSAFPSTGQHGQGLTPTAA